MSQKETVYILHSLGGRQNRSQNICGLVGMVGIILYPDSWPQTHFSLSKFWDNDDNIDLWMFVDCPQMIVEPRRVSVKDEKRKSGERAGERERFARGKL